MSDWKLHTPDGVNDILPEECKKKKELENTLWTVFSSMGYNEIETPTLEFYDVFAGEGGQISQENMFKFFDENGRIMVLRPDITTPIARMVATKDINSPLPLRYCYTSNVFRMEQTQGVRQREFTQSGIELIGASSPVADAEVISAAMEAILTVGIEEFQMEIGQVAFFNGLVEQAGLNSDDIERLRERIDSKDTLGIKQLTDKLNIDNSIKQLMIDLPYLFGGKDVFAKANVDGLNETSKNALINIEKIYNLLCDYGYEKYVSVDLGMLQSIDYYTGTIFKCFTHGIGFPICAGGRYDSLINKFGKNISAVGVAFGLNRILSALRACGLNEDEPIPATLIFAEKDAEILAYDISYNLRRHGCIVETYLGDGDINTAEQYALSSNKECMMRVFADGKLLIREYDKGTIIETTADEFTGEHDYDECDCGHDCSCEHEHNHDCSCGCED